MELKEQLDIAQEAVRKALIIALEQKEDFKANKLFKILGDVREVMPLRYEPGTASTFSITSNPDIISFGGADSGICLG
jgi:hypothetical protein